MKTPTINLRNAKEQSAKFACNATSKITMNVVVHFGTLFVIAAATSALQSTDD